MIFKLFVVCAIVFNDVMILKSFSICSDFLISLKSGDNGLFE